MQPPSHHGSHLYCCWQGQQQQLRSILPCHFRGKLAIVDCCTVLLKHSSLAGGPQRLLAVCVVVSKDLEIAMCYDAVETFAREGLTFLVLRTRKSLSSWTGFGSLVSPPRVDSSRICVSSAMGMAICDARSLLRCQQMLGRGVLDLVADSREYLQYRATEPMCARC